MRCRPILALLVSVLLAGCAVPTISKESGPSALSAGRVSPAAEPSLAAGVLLSRWNAKRRRNEIVPVNASTGREVPNLAPVAALSPVVSHNGKTLVTVESHGSSPEAFAGWRSSYGTADVLQLLDVRTWQNVAVPFSAQSWVGQPAWRLLSTSRPPMSLWCSTPRRGRC